MKKHIFVGLMILTGIITINMTNEKKASNPLLTEWKTVHETPPFTENLRLFFLQSSEVFVRSGF